MTIDTKTTAGGAVVLLLSGTGGYVATNAIKGEENKPSLKTEEASTDKEQDAEGTTTLKAKATEKSNSETMKEKMVERKFGEEVSEDADCKAALDKTYDETNFKSAVLACFKTKTFKDRATQLNVQLIEGDNKTQLFDERFTALGEQKVKKFADDTAAQKIYTESNKAVKRTVSDFCQKVEILTWSSINNNDYPVEKEWEGYLKLCAKEAGLTKNFWTGQ